MDEKIELKILNFLININKILDGIQIQDITEFDHPRPFLKFSANLTSHFIDVAWWSPSQIFFDVIEKTVYKHFSVDSKKIEWNNTKTVFWFHG